MLNLGQISYESFFCRPNGSQLKLSLKIAQLNFSYFAKIPPWLEMGGRKNQPHAKGQYSFICWYAMVLISVTVLKL